MLKIFVLGHSEESFSTFAKKDFLETVNLNNLNLVVPNVNDYGEARFFMQPLQATGEFPEYVGTLTWRHNSKYLDAINLELMDTLEPQLLPHVVYASAPTSVYFKDWISHTNACHRNIWPYVEGMSDVLGMRPKKTPTLWANNFVCHREVMRNLMALYSRAVPAINDLYGTKIQIQCEDPRRTIAYLYERLTMTYFSNRNDLEIRQMPDLFSRFVFFGSYTANYKQLHDLWRKTLLAIGVKPHNIRSMQFPLPDQPASGEVRFKTRVYAMCLMEKVRNLVGQLKSYRDSGESHAYVVFSDCDIWFLEHRQHSWKELVSFVEGSEGDLFFPFERETDEGKTLLNSGFLIFKRSNLDKAIHYYESMMARLFADFEKMSVFDFLQRYPFVDQTVVNEESFGLKITAIPPRWHIQGGYFKAENAKTVLFHHAIHTHTVREKMDQIEATAGKLLGY